MKALSQALPKQPDGKKEQGIEQPRTIEVRYESVADDRELRAAAESGEACPACYDAGMVIDKATAEPIPCPACADRRATVTAEKRSTAKEHQTFEAWKRNSFPGAADEGTPDYARDFLEGWTTGHEPPWVVLIGPNRTGKTHCGNAVCRRHVERGEPALFANVPDLLIRLRGGFDDGSYGVLLEAVRTAPILVLDDIGKEKTTDWAAEQLYVVTSDRYERPTVFTTNLDLPAMDTRLRSRISDDERCRILRVEVGR